MKDSVFTKIIKGEIPSHKVYEDSKTFAFMDIHPIQPGHVLVVPKTPAETIWDLQSEDYQALMDTVKKVGLKLREMFPEKTRIAVMIEGLDIAHAHVKVFPIDSSDEYRHLPDPTAEPDHRALAEMARKLAI